MKLLLSAAAAVALFAAPALAQTPAAPPAPASPAAPAACPAAPADPTLPDGATAKAPEMTKANAAYEEWVKQTTAHMNCERGAVQAMQNQLLALKAEIDGKLKVYNDKVAALKVVETNWGAEVAEFNGRQKKR